MVTWLAQHGITQPRPNLENNTSMLLFRSIHMKRHMWGNPSVANKPSRRTWFQCLLCDFLMTYLCISYMAKANLDDNFVPWYNLWNYSPTYSPHDLTVPNNLLLNNTLFIRCFACFQFCSPARAIHTPMYLDTAGGESLVH